MPIAWAAYDEAANTVTLTLKKPIKANRRFQFTVRDSLVDQAGLALDGNGDGQPGGSHVIEGGVWQDRLEYTDRNGDAVALTLQPLHDLADPPAKFDERATIGLMELVWGADGEARSFRLVNVPPGLSTLRGRVQAQPGGDGLTTFQSISGLAGVRNRLPLCADDVLTGCFQVDRLDANLVDLVVAEVVARARRRGG